MGGSFNHFNMPFGQAFVTVYRAEPRGEIFSIDMRDLVIKKSFSSKQFQDDIPLFSTENIFLGHFISTSQIVFSYGWVIHYFLPTRQMFCS